jgi:hypothetical protein
VIADLLASATGGRWKRALKWTVANEDAELTRKAMSSLSLVSKTHTYVLTPIPIPGDFNYDGTVNAADYVVWRKTDDMQAGYVAWRSHFGEPPSSGASNIANASVAKPPILVMLMIAVTGRTLRQRKKHHQLVNG